MTIKGEWVYGLVAISQGRRNQPESGHYISNEGGMPWAYHVRPETVGLSTGLNDKNGVEIYEGDIVRDRNGVAFESKWNPKYAAFWIYEIGKVYYGDPPDVTTMEVIGNIYENPDLLPAA